MWQDERYRTLQVSGSLYNAVSQTDGAELTLSVWREFGARPDLSAVSGPAVDQAINMLRIALPSVGLWIPLSASRLSDREPPADCVEKVDIGIFKSSHGRIRMAAHADGFESSYFGDG